MQYSPEPPFVAGVPAEAGPEITRNMQDIIGQVVEDSRTVARSIRRVATP